MNEGERGAEEEMEKAAEMAEAARRAAEKGLEAEAGAGVRGGWEVGGCRETAAARGSRTRVCLSHTQPGRSFPWQNLSAFIGASVTLLIGY